MPNPNAEPARKRGGQPGNTNAVTSGFFAKAKLSAHSFELLAEARAERSVADVVDILYVELARLIEAGGYDAMQLAALSRAVVMAILAEHKMTGGDDKRDAFAALDAVLADVRRQETT